MSNRIEPDQVVKTLGHMHTPSGLSLQVCVGEVHVLSGLNRSGKLARKSHDERTRSDA